METIRNFRQMIEHLRSLPEKKRVVVACPHDAHTLEALKMALDDRLILLSMVVTPPFVSLCQELSTDYPGMVDYFVEADIDSAIAKAVALIRGGQGNVLMKGTVNTDNLLRAVLNKEHGLLPKGRVLTHLALTELSTYPKLLVLSDAAVIPQPTYEQYRAMLGYALQCCRRCGIEVPKVALIHCTEKTSEKFPVTLSYQQLKQDATDGVFGTALVDGPMDVKCACDKESAVIKKIDSPVAGDADVLIFPDLEAGNAFYKALSFFANASMAGALVGASCPMVVSSRSDSVYSKYASLALACLLENES
jgi:phosphate butyryltransferase